MMTGKRPPEEIGTTHRIVMRTFVDKLAENFLSADEIPDDYVADVDRDSISFQVTTTSGIREVRWPHLFYQLGSSFQLSPSQKLSLLKRRLTCP